MSTDINVKIHDVKSFWNQNPVAAGAIPYPLGSAQYFEYYNKLREKNESIKFSYQLHEYKNFANKKVLDVGCGNGYVLSNYAKEGADVYGVDITEKGIELCHKRFELLNLKGNFQVANAEELPFADETFDCVCSMGVLHHVPNTKKAVQEIQRVLKKNGKLIVMFYYKDSALYQINFRMMNFFRKKDIQESVNEVDGVGNPKGDVYTKEELKNFLNKFDNIEMSVGVLKGYMTLPKIGKYIPDFFLTPFEKKWGWFLYAKAVK